MSETSRDSSVARRTSQNPRERFEPSRSAFLQMWLWEMRKVRSLFSGGSRRDIDEYFFPPN